MAWLVGRALHVAEAVHGRFAKPLTQSELARSMFWRLMRGRLACNQLLP
jgi:hypothetical protein